MRKPFIIVGADQEYYFGFRDLWHMHTIAEQDSTPTKKHNPAGVLERLKGDRGIMK